LVGLRITPVFAFAPPFSLVPIPRFVRVLFGLGLSICLVSAYPQATSLADTATSILLTAAARELMLGILFVLVFQLTFAALYLAGRTIDVQAGYGLSLIINPASQTQSPLIGTLFVYAAGAAFFALDGHVEFLRLIAASLDVVPLGAWSMPDSIDRITALMSVAFLTAFGVAGGAILCLFLTDVAIAILSRTVPQMNVLVLGFQVKTIVLLLVLPTSFGVGGALLTRMMATMLQALPRML
jgi:flagellar biosynthetic protein FliR